MYILFFFRSLYLDYKTLQSQLSISNKIEFIGKKYFLLFKNFIFGFQINKSYITLFDKKYYFDDKFGISFLQSVYVDHAFLKKVVRKNGHVIDIGANIGQFNFFSKHFLQAKSVISFEPIPQTFDLLLKNADHKKCISKAVSTKQKLQFYVPELSLMASEFRVTESDTLLEIEGVRLSEINEIKKIKIIELLKIDVEGAEIDTLKACGDVLKKVKYLLIESSVQRASTGDIGKLFAYLEEKKLQFKLIDIGRVHRNEIGISDVDLLFENQKLIHYE